MNHYFMKKKKYIFLWSLFGSIVLLCCGCGQKEAQVQQKTDTAMGTVIRQSVYVTDRNSSVTEEVMELLRSLEQDTLSWRLETSEIYRINQTAGQKGTVNVSKELSEILERCQEVSEKSSGAFDITIGGAARLWKIDEGSADGAGKLPDREELTQAVKDSGYEKLSVREGQVSLPDGMQLDLGAVGKGIALTKIAALLEQHEEVGGAVISVGGSILTFGSRPEGGSWRVGIVDPADTSANIGWLELTGQWCVSTSGDYERYVEIDGVRYHHILDPKTGYPARSGVHSVTILMRDGLLGDALSTACFVLGAKEGMQLAKAYGAEALFVDLDGNISMTEGMEQYFHSFQ